MKVAEIFKSIQGETSYAGLPAAFVRFGGCNLSCSYCDTGYARTRFEEMPRAGIVEKVRELNAGIAVLTGGEPLLQGAELYRLVDSLLEMGCRPLVETNGSLPVSGIPPGAVKIMDIKCPSSGMSGRNLWENVDSLTRGDEVKFVIGNREDYEWSRAVLGKFDLSGKCSVLFSPVWGGGAPLQDIASWILADGLDVRLQVQLHKIIWGDSRGR